MELFNRRYLCFISFAFILTALLLTLTNGFVKIILALIAAVGFVICGIFMIKTKKHRFSALFALLICFAISMSAFSSFFFISRAQNEASELIGRDTVLVKIVSQSGQNEYNARLLRVGEKDVNIKAELTFDTEEKIEYGDELIMNAYIDVATNVEDPSVLLSVRRYKDSDVYLNKAERQNYFSVDGIMALSHTLQNEFAEHVDKTFGDHSALAKGLLVNDTSDIDSKTETNFKRSGTSHILAVSGMHIVLLMGTVELLLRKIEIKKEIRIVVISILSIFFLALTGFEASAVRSVLMLFAVYVCYIFYEENDSITALFTSVAIIVLCSPFSVYDIGMWMSFLATLGILAVYPIFDERMPYPKQENLFVRCFLRLCVWIAKTLMLTVVANFFLLPIMWYFFGAVSISTLPCNLILAPIVTVLMPLCAFTTMLGFIPYIYFPLVFVTNKLFDIMMYIVELFAEARFGVVSLKYEFVPILVIVFSFSIVLLLVAKIKRKLLLFVPMVAFLLSFAVCLSVFTATSKPYAYAVKRKDSVLTFVCYKSECSVIDMGSGDSVSAGAVVNNASIYATEIDKYFIVTPDENDATLFDEVCKNTVVRKLYLPKQLDSADLNVYCDIFKCAEKYNVDVAVFDCDGGVEICNGVMFNYNIDKGFDVSSAAVKIRNCDEDLAIEYQGADRKIKIEKKKSEIIPLN